jgi:heat shock protein HslJ
VSDEYSVYAAGAGESWRTRLTSSGATEPEVGLAGRDFLLQSADGFLPVADTTIRLSFDARELSFYAGCNSHFGSYSLCDGKLCVSGLGSTEIGCDLPLSNQDQWVADFLIGSPVLEQAGAGLTLAGAGATLEFLDSEVADADRPLTGRTWSVDTIIENGGASASFAQPPATLQFGDDGVVSVFTTCNTGYGSYTRSGQSLTLSSVTYTDQSCEGFFLHERITRVMTAGDVTFEIDAAFLTITRGNVGLRATTE